MEPAGTDHEDHERMVRLILLDLNLQLSHGRKPILEVKNHVVGDSADQQVVESLNSCFQQCVCIVCQGVANQPVVCKLCERTMCTQCGKDEGCPNCKGSKTVVRAQKFMRKVINSMKFRCTFQQCRMNKVEMDAKEARKHLLCCPHEEYKCPNGCSHGDAIQGNKMMAHMNVCEKALVPCTKCGLEFSREKVINHDCFAELRKRCVETDQSTLSMREEFGLDFMKSDNIKCARGHPLTARFTKPSSYGGYAYCDSCRHSHIDMQQVMYHCSKCEYDLCRKCVLIRSKRLASTMQTMVHEHELSANSQHSGWKCDCRHEQSDIMKLFTDNNKCASGMTDFYQATTVPRWTCSLGRCDFDICIKCLMKFGSVPLEGVTSEEMRCAYFIIYTSRFQEQDDKICLSKFFDIKQAADIFSKLQNASLSIEQNKQKFGIMVHRGQVFAAYGSWNRIEKFVQARDNLSQPFKKILQGGRGDSHEVTFSYEQPYFSFCACSKASYAGAGIYSCCAFDKDELHQLELNSLSLMHKNLEANTAACLIKFSQGKQLAVTLFGQEKEDETVMESRKILVDCYERAKEPLDFFKLQGLRGSSHAVIYDIGATDVASEDTEKDETETQADEQSVSDKPPTVKAQQNIIIVECDTAEDAEKTFGHEDWKHLTKLLICDKKVKDIRSAETGPGEDATKVALEKAYELGYQK